MSERDSRRVEAGPHPAALLASSGRFLPQKGGLCVLAGAPNGKELLRRPMPKTPSKFRKSQVQTNNCTTNYKAGGGREGKQPQALLK